jgi:hypothetical protein
VINAYATGGRSKITPGVSVSSRSGSIDSISTN